MVEAPLWPSGHSALKIPDLGPAVVIQIVGCIRLGAAAHGRGGSLADLRDSLRWSHYLSLHPAISRRSLLP